MNVLSSSIIKFRLLVQENRSKLKAYLEPSRKSTTGLFCEKSSIVDVRLGSKHASLKTLSKHSLYSFVPRSLLDYATEIKIRGNFFPYPVLQGQKKYLVTIA